MELRLRKFSEKVTARGEWPLALLFLLAVFAAKAAVTVVLYRQGYLEFDGDGFTRSLHAWEWLQKPRFEVDAWLPLQFWLNGLLMGLWRDLYWEPRAVNIAASLVTVVNFFLIGRYLLGKWQGYASALLAGLFPWEIWFGLSGMAESLTFMCLGQNVFWFIRWRQTGQLRPLVFSSLGLMAATMLRYEAWFFSLVYAVLVLFLAYRERKPHFDWRVIPALGLAFVFAAIWMVESWLQLGKPWGFVSLTSEINANLEGKNQSYDLLERIWFYPKILLELMPRLLLPALAGSLLLAWKPEWLGKDEKQRRAIRPYLALIWGQFLLFILSTLPTNNIAPGSKRYPVGNLLLLIPLAVWLFGFVAEQATRWLRPRSVGLSRTALVVIGGLFALLAVSFVTTTLDRDNNFPDGNLRQVALWFKDQTESGRLPENIVIPVHLPNPKADNGGDYQYIYALAVLTNRPDGLRIAGSKAQGLRVISELEGFQRTIEDDKPLAWIHLDTAGDNEAIQKLAGKYRNNQQFGPFLVSSQPLYRPLEVSSSEGTVGQEFRFNGDGYEPGEKVSVWVSWGSNVKNLPEALADGQGRVSITFRPEVAATQSLTAKGRNSNRQGAAEIVVRAK